MANLRKFNPLLWIIALAIINGAWNSVADGEAIHEINDKEHSTEDRTIEISSVFGLDKEITTTFSVKFFTAGSDNEFASWKITDSNGQVIANWQGLVGQEENWQGKLAPGSYVVNTTMDSGVLTEQNLYIQPFENLRIEGHILLSIGLIAIAFLEPVVKNKLSKLIPKTKPEGPLLKRNPFKTNTEGMPEADGFDDEDPWRSPIIN